MTTDPNPAIEVWARMLCAADAHLADGDHPTWQQLRVTPSPSGRSQDDYRKAAAWLLPRLTVAAETRLSRAERRCDELRAESLRRGKTVLEYSEKIRALEREIDGIQKQLGAEILRADQAESAVSAVAPATDQTALRDRIAAALLARIKWATVSKDRPANALTSLFAANEFDLADAVLSVLPASVDRADVLLWAADHLDARAVAAADASDDPAAFVAKARAHIARVWREAARELRRVAAETQSLPCTECDHPKAAHGEGEDPVSPGRCADCPESGEEWHDYQPAATPPAGGAPQPKGA
jgi:hypothetical protein